MAMRTRLAVPVTRAAIVAEKKDHGYFYSNWCCGAKRMTPHQIAEAQRMAREWLAKHQQ